MGLSSSQGRLLMLTAAMSSTEYNEIILSQRQNCLALESQKIASEYNEAMSNYKLVVKDPAATDQSDASNLDLDYDTMVKAGYLATTVKNEIYLKKDEDGKWIIPKDVNGNNLLSIDADGKAVINNEKYDVLDGTKYLDKKEILQSAIQNGTLFLFNVKSDSKGITLGSLNSQNNLEYVLDTTDDAQAQSKYEYEQARISRQDNMIDMEIAQLETEHEALLKEYDSVKEVISKNVDRTFKIFSQG